MNCLAALASLNMLGAILSSHPQRSIAIFQYKHSPRNQLIQVGDYPLPGLQVLKIDFQRRVTFKCQDVVFTHKFMFSFDVESESETYSNSTEGEYDSFRDQSDYSQTGD